MQTSKLQIAGIRPLLYRALVLGGFMLVLQSCDNTQELSGMPVPAAPPRSQDATQLALGEQVFRQHCVACHGNEAQGDANWRKRDADGHYPAPPLNGTGHAWHHSTEALIDVIRDGSPAGQGKMPAWAGKLSEREIAAVVAWFQSRWPQPVYDAWYEMQQRGR